MAGLKEKLKAIFTPEKCLAVYHLYYKEAKGTVLTRADLTHPSADDADNDQTFYDLVYHDVLIPMSKIPLDALLAFDLTELLPSPDAPDFPEQCVGMMWILDQSRGLTGGSYNHRYTRCFFDPICEKLVRTLIALPEDVRPDSKNAWLSRGYSYEQWLIRILMIWAPLIHSDNFMVNHRQQVKDYLHALRSEVEAHYSVTDPYAALEAADDLDIQLFPRMIAEGPPEKSPSNPDEDLTFADHVFWSMRIRNAHFALTDMCGHYPYATEWKGNELTGKDKEWLEKTNNALYNPDMKPVFEQIRRDVRGGVWQPLEPVERFEK